MNRVRWAFAAAALFASGVAVGDTIWVDNRNDSGAGSLRAALELANATPGLQTIKFKHVVTAQDCESTDIFGLMTPLPEIIDDLVIDGYSANLTQKGSDDLFDARVCVNLQPDPNAQVAIPVGLRVSELVTPTVTVVIQGLRFNGFSNAGVELAGGAEHRILGNIFGGPSGAPNGHGLVIGPGAVEVVVGGDHDPLTETLGNWFTNSSVSGLRHEGVDGIVRFNHFGPALAAQPVNATGIELLTDSFPEVEDNVFSGNGGAGAIMDGAAWLLSNEIVANGGDGVRVIGGDPWIAMNLIHANAQAGIRVVDGTPDPTFTDYGLSNRITNNGGLGIDIGMPGVAPLNTDALEPSQAASGGQNFPVLLNAKAWVNKVGSVYRGVVSGTLSSRPDRQYSIDFYANDVCDPSGHGEGARPLGSTLVALGTAPANSDASAEFSKDLQSYEPLVGRFITATADKDGFSEFAACIPIGVANEQPQLTGKTFILDSSQDQQPVTLDPLVYSDDGLPNPPATVTFSIPQNTTPFSISNAAILSGTPDFTAHPAGYEFQVQAYDGELARLATVKVLRNRAPVLLDRSFQVPSTQIGKTISLGPLQATDDTYQVPSGKLSYSLVSNTTPFSISEDGLISGVADAAAGTAGYGLVVQVTDGDLVDTANVRIYVNAPPRFDDIEYVVEYKPGPRYIELGPIPVIDDGLPNPPAKIAYYDPGNPGPIDVYPNGKVIGFVNFDTAPGGYEILVEASDGEAKDTATVRIVPGPANTAPAFGDISFVLPPQPSGQSVQLGPLLAPDDGLPNPPGQVTFAVSGSSLPFTVSPAGVISGTPDFTAKPQGYSFIVIASDGALTKNATVRIQPERIFRHGFQ